MRKKRRCSVHLLWRGGCRCSGSQISGVSAQFEIARGGISKGKLGVAENAAILVDDENIAQRVALFFTQHLVLLIERDKGLNNLHEAYSSCIMGLRVSLVGSRDPLKQLILNSR